MSENERKEILLVVADPDLRRSLEVGLKRAGFLVGALGSAREALSRAEVACPLAIVADGILPEMDGFALRARLREDSRFEEVPFVFLVRPGNLEDRLRAVGLGADDFLPQPAHALEIASRLRQILARRSRDRLLRDGGAAPIDDSERLRETLPPFSAVLEVNYRLLGEKLAELPDEVNGILRLFDGRRTLAQVVEDAPVDDLAALDTIARLRAQGLLTEASAFRAAPDSEARIEAWLSAAATAALSPAKAETAPIEEPRELEPAPSGRPATEPQEALPAPRRGSRRLPLPRASRRPMLVRQKAARSALDPAWSWERPAADLPTQEEVSQTSACVVTVGPSIPDALPRAPEPSPLASEAAAVPASPAPAATARVEDEASWFEQSPAAALEERRPERPDELLYEMALAATRPRPKLPWRWIAAGLAVVAVLAVAVAAWLPSGGEVSPPALHSGTVRPLDSPGSPAPTTAPASTLAAGTPSAAAATPEPPTRPGNGTKETENARGLGAEKPNTLALLRQAQALVRREKYSAAANLFRKVLASDPDHAEAQYGLGYALYEAGLESEAQRHLERALALRQGPAEVHVLLGAIHQDRNEVARARQAYERYLQTSPRGRFADELRSILRRL
jgi:CheY-like chemotaxis protein/tetratricopeptide (TPR) repeat protein